MQRRTSWMVVGALALSFLGGKCKGPKHPVEEAADAVEEAFWSHDVRTSLHPGEIVTVQAEVLIGDPPRDAWATITFEAVDDAWLASCTLEHEAFDFVVTADGAVLDAP